MTVKNQQFKVTAPWCSKGCGRKRRSKQRYCAECHREDQRKRTRTKHRLDMKTMTEAQILARAVKNLDRMLKRIKQ